MSWRSGQPEAGTGDAGHRGGTVDRLEKHSWRGDSFPKHLTGEAHPPCKIRISEGKRGKYGDGVG
jgi:hypothetical protein